MACFPFFHAEKNSEEMAQRASNTEDRRVKASLQYIKEAGVGTALTCWVCSMSKSVCEDDQKDALCFWERDWAQGSPSAEQQPFFLLTPDRVH